MKIICGMMAHNEDWVLPLSVRAALLWCDEVLVLAHRCTDETLHALKGIERVSVIEDFGPFRPSYFHTALTKAAYGRGATHVAMLDADEVVSGNLLAAVKQATAGLAHNSSFQLPWIPIVGNLHQRAISGPRADWKTGFVFTANSRYVGLQTYEYDWHNSRFPKHVTKFPNLIQNLEDGGLMHLAYVDERRARAKALRWKLMEVLHWPNRTTVAELNSVYQPPKWASSNLGAVPEAWWVPYGQWEALVRTGGESWEEKEAKQLWHGNYGKFLGITTLGII